MKMNCEQCLPLVPAYLDGELGETLAAPLRGHLLACHTCREVAQGERALSGWFQPSEPVAVPPGFAARIARLAFAGATATDESEAAPERLAEIPRPARGLRAPALVGGGGAASSPSFLIGATAAAAALLFTLALALGGRDLPTGDMLYADTQLTDVLEDLDRLHAEDSAAPSEDPARSGESGASASHALGASDGR